MRNANSILLLKLCLYDWINVFLIEFQVYDCYISSNVVFSCMGQQYIMPVYKLLLLQKTIVSKYFFYRLTFHEGEMTTNLATMLIIQLLILLFLLWHILFFFSFCVLYILMVQLRSFMKVLIWVHIVVLIDISNTVELYIHIVFVWVYVWKVRERGRDGQIKSEGI